MVCAESMELERVWKRRYEVAKHMERGGLFAVSMTKSSHSLLVRQQRAKQAQAANAILMHRKHCSICNSALQDQSLAS